MNIIRYLCRTWWGGHPATLLAFYKAFIRSQLDYGSIVLQKCAKRLTKKLDAIQYQALRTCTGLMKSTPINVLLSESGEMPLDLRRIWLATKLLAKALALTNNPTAEQALSIYINYNDRFDIWKRYQSSPIVEAMDFLLPVLS